MILTLVQMFGVDFTALEPAQQETYTLFLVYVSGVLVILFVVMIIDFLARILSRFIPRWNRNS